MAFIDLNNNQNFITLDASTWGLTIIGNEIYVGSYSSTTVKVYDITTKILLRTFTACNARAFGTDGINLYMIDGSYKINHCDKINGSIIQYTGLCFPEISSSASFYIDKEKDIICYCCYDTYYLAIRKFSDGTLIKQYKFSSYTCGVTIVGNAIFVSVYGLGKLYIGSLLNDLTNITFRDSGLSFNYINGLANKDNKIYMSTYSTNAVLTLDIYNYLGNECATIDEIKNLGDVIPCRYTALTAGQVGYFSELGTCTATEIPVAGTTTPDGLFYLIMVGYDSQGRQKFAADRNIQTGISWDALNSAGICSEVPIYIYTNDLCNNGNAICYSDASYSPSNAFDNDIITGGSLWFDTAILGSNVNGVEWIGYDFGENNKKSIRKMTLVQQNTNGYSLSSIKVQNSDDKLTWRDVSIFTVTQNSVTRVKDTLYLPKSNSARYWRILANSATTQYQWRVVEIEMMELISTFSARLPTGGTSSTDKDNEWDKIICESNLGGTITPGDDNIWHWSNLWSWTSTTNYVGNSVRTLRGKLTVTTNSQSSTIGSNGFRPVMLVENNSIPTPVMITKYLIKQDLNIYDINPTNYTILPTNISDLHIVETLTDVIIESCGVDWSNLLSILDLFKGTKYKLLKFIK